MKNDCLGSRFFVLVREGLCAPDHIRAFGSRTLQHLDERHGPLLEADGALHVGTVFILGILVDGLGSAPVFGGNGGLQGRDRSVAGPTAPAAGLLFLGPRYPRQGGLAQDVCSEETSC